MANPEALVRERVGDLLAKHDPSSTVPQEFWGAQFDLGLAWVNFPEGEGGLGVAPGLQQIVTEALQRAGAPSNFARNGIGVGMGAPVVQTFGSPELRQRLL